MTYKPRYDRDAILINASGYIIRIEGVNEEEATYLSTSFIRKHRRFMGMSYRGADWVDRQFRPYRMGERHLDL